MQFRHQNHMLRNSLIVAAICVVILAVAGVLIWYLGFYHTTKPNTNSTDTSSMVSTGNNAADNNASSQSEYDYQSLYPDMYVPQVDKISNQNDKVVYLTFNNAPSSLTEPLLDLLDEHDAKATFFLYTGNSSDGYVEQIAKEIADHGDTVGVLTDSYDYSNIYASVENYLADFNKAFELIYQATGQKPTVFRFAGGSVNAYNKNTINAIVAEMQRRGFTYYDWSYNSGDDSNATTAKQIHDGTLKWVLSNNKSVILMQNASSDQATLDQLPDIIDQAKAQGYAFQALDPSVMPFTMPLPQ